METHGRLSGFKKAAVASTMGVASVLSLGGCDLEDFSTTTTTTLDGRDVAMYIAEALIVTPIEEYLTNAIDEFFDDMEDD